MVGRTILKAAALLIMAIGLVQCAPVPRHSLELSAGGFAAAQAAFRDLLAGRGTSPPVGFTIRRSDGSFDGGLITQTEGHGQCRGGGQYLLRSVGPDTRPLLVSAPHRGFDRFTGTLAHGIFVEETAAAAAWNSVPRYSSNCGAPNSDLARLVHHPFTAFALAFAATYPQGRVVQIHGFHPAKRVTAAGRAASVILSNGADEVTPAVGSIAHCLRQSFPAERIAIFPTDVSELGARTNVQGQQLRAAGFGGFVHVEVSLSFRERLANDVVLRRLFGRCLAVEL